MNIRYTSPINTHSNVAEDYFRPNPHPVGPDTARLGTVGLVESAVVVPVGADDAQRTGTFPVRE